MIEREKLISMVQGLQKGDPDAATELFETFQKDTYYFILKTVNNDHELAEDLTQDTFVSILENISKLDEPAAFVSWSKQIAYHKCTDYFKKKKELLADEDEDGYSIFDTAEEDNIEFIPDAALDHKDLRQTIIGMINELPEDQRSAILLRYFNEMSVKEIAEIQGVSEGTVKSRLNYGRKAIKQSVEAYEKKNEIKLHCAGVIPLLFWLFKMYRIENGLSITSNTTTGSFAVTEGVSVASTTTVSGVATTATTATTTATYAVANSTAGIGVKALVAKVIAVIAAATITVGGVIIATNSKDESKPIESPQESWSTETSIAETSMEPLTITESTEAAMEEVTKATQIPTEPPTEATTVPTTEATEPPTTEDDSTDTTTESTDGATEPPLPSEDSDHNETEPSVNPEECSHDWEYKTNVYLTTINEVRECKLCGAFELLDAYSNNCEHDFQVDSSWINDFGEECFSYKCVKCGSGSLG